MKIPKQEYTSEFKELSVKRVKSGQSISAVKCIWIDAQRRDFGLGEMWAVLDISESGYRSWKHGGRPQRKRLTDAQMLALIPAPALMLQERYFAASELDVIPKVQQNIELYPEELQHIRQGGKVVLSLWMSETGKIEKIELVSSELPVIFAEVATQRFMQASFFLAKETIRRWNPECRQCRSFPLMTRQAERRS